RDTQHLLNIGLLTWFWFTPIVYPSGYMYTRLAIHHGTWLWLLYLANPMAAVVFGFQRAFYGNVCPPAVVKSTPTHSCQLPPVGVGWLAMLIGFVLVGSVALLYLL